jgi:peptidoglycan/LPS O-acetylase OafA/YrhL
MGLLRYYLAAAVIAWHSDGFFGFTPMPGYTAVQIFFIVSGFYMALVLNTKYTGPGSYQLFLTNRMLRIYPAYLVMLCLTFALSVVAVWYHRHSRISAYFEHGLSPFSWFVLVTSNLSLLGQDIVLFFDLRPDGSFGWPTNWRHRPEPHLYEFMFLPQAWSLSLELMFYAVAPFLVRRPLKQVVAVILASLGLRIWIYGGLGLNLDPWGSRFFPTELALFLGGTLSYLMYERLKKRSPDNRHLVAIGIAFAAVTLSYPFLIKSVPPGYDQYIMLAYFIIIVFVLPALFLWTKDNRADRYIGELSYPIYIVHLLILSFVTTALKRRLNWSPYTGLLTLGFSTILAAMLVHGLIDPIDKFRHRLSRRNDRSPNRRPAEPYVTSVT